MEIRWKRAKGVGVNDVERERLARDAIKMALALQEGSGIGIVTSGDACIVATTEGDGVVEVYDCTIEREAEVEVEAL